ncbi:MAG: N-6 DNA methylase [Solirubrobacteraceae bacterium]
MRVKYLAVHGLSGEIREANSYYEDPHHSVGRFDFVMANPPFNVDKIDKAKLEGDRRFPAVPRADNGNYIWIQMFATALNEQGRAGFVMANFASDARHSEAEIRRKLIEDRLVDVMVAIGPNFFYTVTLPVTLWFLDRGKAGTARADQVLFIDARKVFRQIDRAHRDFTEEQIEFLANIVRVYRSAEPEFAAGTRESFSERFPSGTYEDVGGLCRVATVPEIEEQGWSLNPAVMSAQTRRISTMRYSRIGSLQHRSNFETSQRRPQDLRRASTTCSRRCSSADWNISVPVSQRL